MLEPSPVLVYRPGSTVMLGDISALVRSVQVSNIQLAVIYSVVWWNGPDRVECWVADCEITGSADERIPIGFHKP